MLKLSLKNKMYVLAVAQVFAEKTQKEIFIKNEK
jgi:hypothetical protein